MIFTAFAGRRYLRFFPEPVVKGRITVDQHLLTLQEGIRP